MAKFTKAISLGMAVAMMATSLPNLAAADDDDRGRRHQAREYRDDDRGHRRAERHYKKERNYKHYKKERHHKRAEKRRRKEERHRRRVEKRRHKEERHHRRVEKRHHKKVVVHKYHEKRVVVHKHKHKYKKKKRSHDLLPLLAVVGLTAAVLHANAAQAKPKSRDIDWNPPPAPRQVARVQPEPQGPASTCLMTREYQTQIVVNGKLVDGYGHACLQPDGTWYRGPAVIPNY